MENYNKRQKRIFVTTILSLLIGIGVIVSCAKGIGKKQIPNKPIQKCD